MKCPYLQQMICPVLQLPFLVLRVSPGIGPRGMRFLTIAGLAAFGLFRAGFDRAAERHVCGF